MRKVTIAIALSLSGIALYIITLSLSVSSNNQPLSVEAQGLEVKRYLGLYKSDFQGHDGKGITVAIVDSGLQPHNDIDRSKIIYFKDFVNDRKEPYDDFGHGTAIAGIIGANGKYKGIAPEINFVILKVTDSNGQIEPDVLSRALYWLDRNKKLYNIRIVNLSVGVYTSLPFQKDPLYPSIKGLNKQGTIIVSSAGNNGPEQGTILSPGTIPEVITVGYINNKGTYSYNDDEVGISSSRDFDNGILNKPDLVTVGIDISSLDHRTQNGYTTWSGSSFSAAIVSGVAAILSEKFKDKPSSYVEDYLRRNVIKLNNSSESSQGNGGMNIN